MTSTVAPRTSQGSDAISSAPPFSNQSVDLSDEESDTDYREDWDVITEEKDSFSNQERQRNIGGLQWRTIESHKAKLKPRKDRRGSILSSFEVGHHEGVPLKDDPAEKEAYERERQRKAAIALGQQIESIEDYPQLQKDVQEGRLGSVLSAFTKQNQHYDDVILIPEEPSTERRGSNVGPTIGRIENYPTLSKDSGRENTNGTILSVFKDDHDEILAAAEVPLPGNDKPASTRKGITFSPTTLEAPKIPNSKKVGERRGSVLSMWSDKSGAFSSDEEDLTSISSSSHSRRSSKLDPPIDKALRRPSNASGRENRGSILSLWGTGKDKDGKDVIHHGEDSDS